ncbi:MAG TPA: MlaD family protein [Pseudonocardia sp.]|jgi:phospholipid/cholesterol/gamma-HCH transport system substrate-binding protein|nr:MlaD family protein [Pseudonocardia sp.]
MRTLTRITAALVVALVVTALSFAVTAATPRDEKFLLTGEFVDASPLDVGNEVKASGVNIGSIVGLTIRGGHAFVDMLVDGSVLPLHNDAKLTITAKDVLGERFVKLDRGSPSAPVASAPYAVPVDRTSTEVTVEDVVNSLDDPTSAGFAGLLTTLGEGLHENGPQAAAAIKALAPAMQQADELSRLLSEQNTVLTSLVDSTSPVAAELAADRGQQLDNMVGATERTLSAVAANRQAVSDSLQRLPSTLTSAQRTLGQTANVAESATPSLRDARPFTDNLVGISRELRDFSDAADPALHSLTPVLKKAQDLIDEARPVVDDLHAAGGDLRTSASSVRKVCEVGVLCKRFTNLMEFIRFWSQSTSGYDGLSHYFRAAVKYSPVPAGRTVAGPIPGAPDTPFKPVPMPSPGRVPLPGTCDRVSNHPCDHETGPDSIGGRSATGLTSGQESHMLGQMLGGH